MNLFNDLVKIQIFFLILILSGIAESVSFSQDKISYHTNLIHVNEIENENYCTGISREGWIYIPWDNTIIVTDGIYQKTIKFVGNPRLVAGNSKIFYFTAEDAGYFFGDSLNQPSFCSFQHHFSFPFSRIQQFQIVNDVAYLIADSSLFQIVQNELFLIDPDFRAGKFLATDNEVFIFKSGNGIKKIGNSLSDSRYTNIGKFVPDLILGSGEEYLIYSSKGNRLLRLHGETDLWVYIPWYKKWWFRLIVGLTSALFLFIGYKIFIFKYLRTPPSEQDFPVSKMVTKEFPKSDLFSQEIKPVPADKSKWEKFELATVLFSDIQGFTKIAEQMNPEMLIDELDRFFFHFDSVCEKYEIEKIKTIGDAYMATGGIPKQNSTNPIEVVLAALEMQQYMRQLKNTSADIWDLRIGIHSGPVIGGIIGHKKRSYDIWGDTVNIASRMESSGEPGKVNISGITYNIIKDFFICEYRGKLPVKYKGNIDMYFVKGLRPELSSNLGSIPNRIFFLRLQHLRLRDLENVILNKLESELPKSLFFHTCEYVKHLYSYSGLLAKAENLNPEENLIIKTSVLLLYTGLTKTYKNFENKSAEYARQVLPDYKFNDTQINSISNVILYAKIPENPQTVFENIIHDVITEYYGRPDYIALYKLLFLEMNENTGKMAVTAWKDEQIGKLKKHQYYTLSGKRLSEVSLEQQIKNIEMDTWQ